MNNGITTMSNPYRRVIFALSFIRGPNIDNWVDAQLQELKTKVSRQQNPVGQDEEVLWTDFETAFKGHTPIRHRSKAHTLLYKA